MKIDKILVLYIFFFICAACSNKNSEKINRDLQPNILFIAIDDYRHEINKEDNEKIITPNIDKIVGKGRLFTHHYAVVPTCGASRFSLMTGHYPVDLNGLRNDIFEKVTAGQPPKEKPESFVELFRRNGYSTIGIGKISHSADGFVYGYRDSVSSVMELPNSWDEFHFDSGKWRTGWNAFFGYANGENRQSLNEDVKPYEAGNVDDDGYPDGLTANLAVQKISELSKSENPFFLAVGFFKPHLPFTSPQKYWDLYDDASIPLTNANDIPKNTNKASFHESGEFNRYKNGEEKANLEHELSEYYSRKLKHAYFAAVSYTDRLVGNIINALEENGLNRNTIIVIWGDHGWHLGDQRVWGKHTLSEYALRSKLIIKTPDIPFPGIQSDAIVETTDLYPTLLDLAGISIPDGLDGSSLLKILKDPTKKVDERAYGYYNKGITMRNQRYRITKYFRDEEPTIELYDYIDDPFETKNIAQDKPDLVNKLLNELEEGNANLYEINER